MTLRPNLLYIGPRPLQRHVTSVFGATARNSAACWVVKDGRGVETADGSAMNSSLGNLRRTNLQPTPPFWPLGHLYPELQPTSCEVNGVLPQLRTRLSSPELFQPYSSLQIRATKTFTYLRGNCSSKRPFAPKSGWIAPLGISRYRGTVLCLYASYSWACMFWP